jgi:hypothetical protein
MKNSKIEGLLQREQVLAFSCLASSSALYTLRFSTSRRGRQAPLHELALLGRCEEIAEH